MVDRVAAPAAATARAPRPPLARKEAPMRWLSLPTPIYQGCVRLAPAEGAGRLRARDPLRGIPRGTRQPDRQLRPHVRPDPGRETRARTQRSQRLPPHQTATASRRRHSRTHARRRRHKTSTSNPLQPHRHHRASRGRLTRRRRGSCESRRCYKPEASLFYFSYGQLETDVVFCSTLNSHRQDEGSARRRRRRAATASERPERHHQTRPVLPVPRRAARRVQRLRLGHSSTAESSAGVSSARNFVSGEKFILILVWAIRLTTSCFVYRRTGCFRKRRMPSGDLSRANRTMPPRANGSRRR